ncbi:MAG: hypothetical protein AAF654_01075 [Myxococcota bacterium]
MILAVDLGLRCGLACYGRDGELKWFRSHHFSDRSALKRAAYRIVQDARPECVVLEGDARLAAIWSRVAEKQGAIVLHPTPEQWREELLLPRQRQSGTDAKAAARALAIRLIDEHANQGATELRTDTAEAICLGYWALRGLG